MIFQYDVMLLFFAEINENFVDGKNEKNQKLFRWYFFKPGDVMSELAANGND
jgi:hypothetical protein